MRFVLSFLFSALILLPAPIAAAERLFTEFSVDLPEGWDGSERAGFISKNSAEYMLVLGKKDAQGERYLAHITLFLLPNKPGKDSHESAKVLAAQQADASEPVERNGFWVFTGNPRDNVLKGMAETSVRANTADLLIIIVKDPEGNGAAEIVKSLRPQSERAKALLQ